MSAVQAGLDTAEILEAILLKLDNKTLLLFQRVSKTFKNVIDGSIHLQRKLFFQQAAAVPLIQRVTQQDGCYNPLLSSGLWGDRTRSKSSIPCGHERGFRILNDRIPAYRWKSRLMMLNLKIKIFPKRSDTSVGKRESGNESWRRMHFFKGGFGADYVNVEFVDGHGRTLRWTLEMELPFGGLAGDHIEQLIKMSLRYPQLAYQEAR
ncbi:F-box domain-containing [Lecanosticta acicola]|uniref:F-box domain-containing n=1 Tax=Lecanosticta acicola TaxID=111012 RepID=A0AAI8YVR0_9PEZI|nr:F-box domain-containing [Lecanosticta acicola]